MTQRLSISLKNNQSLTCGQQIFGSRILSRKDIKLTDETGEITSLPNNQICEMKGMF